MEVLVAAFILVVGLMAAAAFIGNAIGSTARSEYMNQAATLASEKLEDLNRWPAAYNVNTGLDSGDPHVIVTNGVSAGSLTADVVQNVTANGTTEAVNYYDLVYFSPSQGSLEEIVSSLDPLGNPQYTTIIHPATGMLQDPPPPPSSTLPSVTGAIGFKRRWIIEFNPSVAGSQVTGVRRITVEVDLQNVFVQPAVQFQMSIVRP
jgi:hypothetical protein